MEDIRRVVRTAARRLLLIDLIGSAAWALTIVTVALIVVLIVDRSASLGLPWLQIAGWAAGAGALGAVGWALSTRAREAEVARVLDERAQLRESLSTALSVERDDDAWSRAVVASATAKARRVVVPDALPIEGPRFWQVPLATLLAFAVLWFLMPTMDILGKDAERQAQADSQREIQDAKTEATSALEKTKELLARSNIELGDLEADALELSSEELDEKETAAEVRNIAMRKLTSLTEQLDEKLDRDEFKAADKLETMLRQMRTPGQGPLTELARDLARGDMRGAKEELEKLKQQMSEGSMSKAQQEQLAKQLDNIAKQLDDVAKQRSELEQALRQAGMSAQQARQAASNPQQMQQAMQQMQNLTDEQKQQLQQQAQAMQQAQGQAQNLSQAMQNMAQAMQAGQQQQAQQAAQQMGDQLSAMEMTQQDMQAMDQAMQQAMQQLQQLGQSGGQQSWAQGNNPGMNQGMGQTGQWQPGMTNQQGAGSGGPGQGNGVGPEAEGADFMTESIKARVNNQGGPIIGSRLVFGDSIRGESVQDFAGAVAKASEQATSEALEEQLVPREYHESVKAYFGRLERQAAEQRSGEPASADDPE